MKITALAGGVGGAKLADGLAQVLPPDDLTVIVNTGDDFEHLGLYICPDLDTVCYTLAGTANPDTGWGRMNETWKVIDNVGMLGGPDWFRLGDQDLGTHLERTRRLKAGDLLGEITRDFCAAWGIKHTVLPMSNQPVRTIVSTEEGDLPFQEYFVHRRCEPSVKAFRFEGADSAKPAPGVREALRSSDAVVVCPSNPWVSIDPILAVLGIVDKPMIAVSPIIGGDTIKGPAAKMYREMGIEPSAIAVAQHYRSRLRGFVMDHQDKELEKGVEELGMQILITDTIMKDTIDRKRLAVDILKFIGEIV